MVTVANSFDPNTDAIRADLSFMTARWSELDERCFFELRTFREGDREHYAQFPPERIDDAVAWAIAENAQGRNVYAVRNPIRSGHTGPANDNAIVAAFFCWADCDDSGATDNVRKFSGPKWTAAITTGRVPDTRVHLYWELEEPTRNMDAWRAMQVNIAAHFQSDPVVINPSRIMRVGGTITWPPARKIAKGYVPELCAIRTTYDDERQPVAFDRLLRVFPQKGQPQPGEHHIDIGEERPPLDRERTRIQALSGEEWHNAVIRLVASYVTRGLADDEIHALTDPLTLDGYTIKDTRREVQAAIEGARRKGWARDDWAPNFDHDRAPTPSDPEPNSATWKVQRADAFTADFVAPEYLIDGVVQRGKLYTLTAPTGSGKTAAMLYAATAIGTGITFCDREIEHGDVLFLAGENPDDVRARVIATMEFYGIKPGDCRLHFVAGTFSIRKDMERLKAEADKLPDLTLIVIDTFAAYFDGDDENNNAQALDFARVVRRLTTLSSKPAVIMPAHPVKNATRSNLTPKGGSSLLNEVDGNLTLWNDEGLLTLHWQGKHRGPDFDPVKMELQKYECAKLHDRNGRMMPTILAKPLLELRAIQIAQETLSREDQLLLSIEKDEAMSMAGRCDATGIPGKGALGRALRRLEDQKLIRRFRTNWELTDGGKKAVAMIRGGANFAGDVE